MNIVDLCNNKQVKMQQMPNGRPYLREQWELHFANHLSDDEKKSIFLHDDRGYCGYLWHLFSYKKRECLRSQDANRAFNQTEKNACYVFYQYKDEAYMIENLSMITADELMDEADIYIVDKEFNWTYVITHETGLCGPYFSSKN